ncbi:MAG TPA: gliding motility-associated C-terminal domain-containing protein, partial [Saprospiraceae bacterium]|nr:gliding motility-associated C-terminal domain-containing protein [Saprospiraceae bacterium]
QDGTINDSCSVISAINIPVNTISGSVYYKVNPTVFHYQPILNNRAISSAITVPLQQLMVCHQPVVSTGLRQEEICEGETLEGYTQTGTYVDTLVSAEGCDSIRTLQLTVVPRSISQINKTICEGDSYLGHSATGLYTDTLSASTGCDSIRILNLNTTSTFLTTENKTICFGKTYFGHDLAGIYIDTLISSFGCDSIRTLQLDILPEITSQASVSLCDGLLLGHAAPGIFIDTLLSGRGCDSILTLEVKPSHRYIPNVFSPNGDQVNDVFEITSYPEPDLPIDYFAIFDRFGNMVYEKPDGEVKWDGKDKSGNDYNPGVFAYILISICGGKNAIEHGTITLIR